SQLRHGQFCANAWLPHTPVTAQVFRGQGHPFGRSGRFMAGIESKVKVSLINTLLGLLMSVAFIDCAATDPSLIPSNTAKRSSQRNGGSAKAACVEERTTEEAVFCNCAEPGPKIQARSLAVVDTLTIAKKVPP